MQAIQLGSRCLFNVSRRRAEFASSILIFNLLHRAALAVLAIASSHVPAGSLYRHGRRSLAPGAQGNPGGRLTGNPKFSVVVQVKILVLVVFSYGGNQR